MDIKHWPTLAFSTCFSIAAYADKYGIDEAMRESPDTSLHDLFWGVLIFAGGYWLWNKIKR